MKEVIRNKLYLFWYKHPRGHGNFGDELNPYLIGKLSSSIIEYVDIAFLSNDKIWIIKILLYNFIRKRLKISEVSKYIFFNLIKRPTVLLAIGSILNDNSYRHFQVWGSGLIARKNRVSSRKFFAVRGKTTRELLVEQGHDVPPIYGDPALLLPMVFTPKSKKKYPIGIIPHYKHYDALKERFSKEILVINLLNSVETVINQINSCDFTLSTSLHGIIVSHAYSIPSLWVDFAEIKDNNLYGDGMKFEDYFSSVNITPYSSVIITKHDKIQSFINSHSHINQSLPDESVLTNLRVKLLQAAPFPLRKNILTK